MYRKGTKPLVLPVGTNKGSVEGVEGQLQQHYGVLRYGATWTKQKPGHSRQGRQGHRGGVRFWLLPDER